MLVTEILIFKMILMLSWILSRSNCILILIIFNLVSSAPLKSQKNSPFQNEQGFSTLPKILEIQLPLKITSKEDLLAWSKYVMTLMASKINIPPILQNSPLVQKLTYMSNSDSKSKEVIKKTSLNEKRQGLNYPARRLKEPPVQSADDKVVAYPLPIGAMQMTASSPQDPPGLPISSINGPIDFGQYMDFNIGNPFQQSDINTFGNFDAFLQTPANTYLPLPPINTAKSYENVVNKNVVNKNVSNFGEPMKLQTTRNSLNLHLQAHNNELGQALPIAVNNGLLIGTNLSHISEPLLTFPFQAVITVAKELPIATMISEMQSKDYTAVRDPDKYFKNDYILMNKSRRVNVFDDFVTEASETKTEGKVKKGKQKEEQKQQNMREQKKQDQKKTKNAKKQKSSVKRQSAILGDLLRTLGILRKLPKNSTEINVAKPVLSILKGTNSQKIQVAFEETPPNRGRPNETFQAQQQGEDDGENDDNGNGGNGNGDVENENDDEGGQQAEAQEEDEEEEGGSVQAVLELLPLAAPVLEELSDPESDVDLGEVLQGAIPLLEGLSDPDEEGGFDIPAVLLPLSQRLSEGPDGQGSDSGAILGPLIQLIAPLSGPLSGPLIGPLSRTSSGPDGIQGSASVFGASAEPLSKPQGPYGQSVLSGLIAGITAKLSKESAVAAGESDVKSLVSSIVSGVLAGASAGSSKGPKGHNTYGQNTYGNNAYGNRDTYHASTTYDSYGKPEAPSGSDLSGPVKEVLGAFLKLSATSSTSSASLSGASSSSSAGLSASSSQSSQEPEKPAYGPPTSPPYAPPPRPSYTPATNSPYVTYTRRRVMRH